MDIIWAFEMMMVRERSVRRESWGDIGWKRSRIYWDDGRIWYEYGNGKAPEAGWDMTTDDLLATDWVEWMDY